MKPTPHTPIDRARHLLSIGLVTLVTASVAYGQSSDADSLRRLQEENAALRKRLAELEGQAQPAPAPVPAPAPAPAPAQASATAAPVGSTVSNDGTVTLSPFEVRSDKDYGYLKTNAATATRIGMEIQRVPMNISVMSEDFIKDTGITNITDILRYTSSGSPDSRFAMRVPGNSATPQGNFTLRGFTVNSLLRNGVFRYNSYNLDNVDRVEIVKGPAAVFFGQGYPGGVINYITKKPMFEKTATTMSYQVDDNGSQKFVMDHNSPLSSNTAFRVIGAWSNWLGSRNHEFRDNINVTPSLAIVPFKSGKVKINLEVEYLKESYNLNDYGWIYPQGWFDAYKNPTAELIAAAGVADATAYRNRIFNSVGNWAADVRKAKADPSLPIYTAVSPYGYYTDKNGNRVEDKSFNFSNSGTRSMNEVKTLQAAIEASPFSWLDARYVFTKDNSRFDSFEGLNAPNADGITFNAASGGNGRGYYKAMRDHQLDVIAKAEIFGIKNKILLGGVHSRPFQQYMATAGAMYNSVPGYNTGYVNSAGTYVYSLTPGPNGEPLRVNPINPGYAVNSGNNINNPNNAQVPMGQYLLNRAGQLLTPQQVYSMWDPAIHPNPPVSKIYDIQRNLLDGYKGKLTAYYVNWQAQMLEDDKLTLLAGYRQESSKGYGQSLVANDPWFLHPEEAYLDQTKYPPSAYNYSPSYAGDPEGFRTRSGDSWMGGVSFALTPEISIYATASKTFKINTGLAGGYDELAFDTLAQDALTHGGGSFTYRGQTITSVAQARAAIGAAGANNSIPNEDGKNFEIGVKTSLWNNKLVSTVSVFRGIRQNQKLDDGEAQANANEPFNYSTSLFASSSAFYNKRNFRWRSVGVKNQITGTDFDVIWTPTRNYQVMVSGAWMWQAETIDNPTYFKPGTAKFNAATAANQALYTMYYNNRIENVPEYRLNVFNKYTFTDTFARGLSIAAGGRYSSETVVSRSLDWNPDRGGFQAGNYVVFDANISYPWELLGYRFLTSLAINNLTDKVYYEGNVAPGDPRTFTLRTSVSF
jgi:outer membrane receptor protein involved in Fe transport